ncbi:MAG: 50S ribosomal protein L22 [Candidatus Moraniibacteriota bacterium]|jgi:large subunit ribosomal protein L22
MKVTAELNNLRISPRKVKLVADLIKGMDALEAVSQLDVAIKKTSGYMQKLLLSAVANAENNFGLAKDNLYVFEVTVGAGQTMKRWMPKAYGRAGQILKRTSHVRIVLEERVEGKGRKTKEQMEKERADKLKKAAAEVKQREKELAQKEKDGADGKEEKTEKISPDKLMKEEKINKSKSDSKTWTNRIFRRKSM